jgi:hypothetical protein
MASRERLSAYYDTDVNSLSLVTSNHVIAKNQKLINLLNMLFRSAAAAIALFAASAQAAGSLDYDYEDFRAWNDFVGSACNGLKNSPVAVKSKECTRYEDYAMTVSVGSALTPFVVQS